jgi:hypothetical protein
MIMNLLNLVRKTSVLLRSPVNTGGGEYRGRQHCTCGVGGICGICSCSRVNARGALRNLACVRTAGPVSICREEDELDGRQPWACAHDASAACAEVVFARGRHNAQGKYVQLAKRTNGPRERFLNGEEHHWQINKHGDGGWDGRDGALTMVKEARQAM